MDLYPAIDLVDGRCVRLYQGDYAQETVYGDDPVAQAQAFEAAGAPWIHIVDLDAARTGTPQNREVIGAVAQSVDVPVQTGGGVRSAEAALALFDLGISRVVIGTAALENPDLVRRLSASRRVAVGLDVRGSEVAVRGWTEGSGRELAEVAAEFADAGVEGLIVTQISRDGTLVGPDVEGLRTTLEATDIPVIASGGVGTLEHFADLHQVQSDGKSLAGVIVGRALYEKKFTAEQAVAATTNQR